MAASSASDMDSLSGKYLHDIVDHLQESIIKSRRARTTEHWNTLREFWKMYKCNETAETERLTIRQKMCKILMNACSMSGYHVDNPSALLNYKRVDWERLKEALTEMVGTTDPFSNPVLTELFFSCSANQILAKHRVAIEADVQSKRDVLSISRVEQSELKKDIHEFIDGLDSQHKDHFGRMMSKLFEHDDENELVLAAPAKLSSILGKEPFLFQWVISEIERVLDHCNQERFGGQEAVLWTLSYEGPPTVSHSTGQKTPQQIRSPQSVRTPTSSEGDFLRRHQPVVLGSIQKSPPRATVASPPRSDRKRNPEIFDENGRVLKRRRWDDGQTTAIIAGLRKHGRSNNKWALILQDYPDLFEDRTSTMIKDRFRTLKKKGEIPDSLLDWLGEGDESFANE